MPFWAVVAGVAAVAGIGSSIKAGKENKKAAKDQAAAVRIENAEARRDFLKSVRVAQATEAVQALAALGGGYESSRGAAKKVSIQTQESQFLKDFDKKAALGQAAAKHSQKAATWGVVSQVAKGVSAFAIQADAAGWGAKDPDPVGPPDENKI
jgi:hypothetical protein